MLAKADQDNIVQVIFLVIILHCTSNFLVQCCLRRIQTTLTRQYCYAMWSQHGRYNIVQVIYLRNVFCLPWANIAQVISSLCNVDPKKSGHHCRLFSSARLFVDCETIDPLVAGKYSFFFFEFSRIFFVWKQGFGVCLLLILHKQIYLNTIK